MANVNYVAIVPQTFEERVAMYMKCKKADLARMMAENEKRLCQEACAELQKNNSDPTLEPISSSASTMD